jgi:hypothetical protein
MFKATLVGIVGQKRKSIMKSELLRNMRLFCDPTEGCSKWAKSVGRTRYHMGRMA